MENNGNKIITSKQILFIRNYGYQVTKKSSCICILDFFHILYYFYISIKLPLEKMTLKLLHLIS